jgi:hypothetical protein
MVDSRGKVSGSILCQLLKFVIPVALAYDLPGIFRKGSVYGAFLLLREKILPARIELIRH